MQDAYYQDREKANKHRSSLRSVNEQVNGLNQIRVVFLKPLSLKRLVKSINKFYFAPCPEGKQSASEEVLAGSACAREELPQQG